MSRTPYILVGLAIMGGCLSVPDEGPVECKSNADCDTANGEVCEENVCYGNPPPGPFAALIAPPAVRNDELVPLELIINSLPQDGRFDDLALEDAVAYSGMVVCTQLCTDDERKATIEVRRPSSFAGGPGFSQKFSTDPRDGTFNLVLPRIRANEAPYSITISPDNRGPDDPPGMAGLVPPFHATLSLEDNQVSKSYDLEQSSPVTLAGTILDAGNNPAIDYRVVARGRWEVNGPIEEVSTVHFLREGSNGSFQLTLSEAIVGDVEIVAQPFDTAQPTLRLKDVAPVGATGIAMTLPTAVVTPMVNISVFVEGTDPGGEVKGVHGARVTVKGTLDVPTPASFTVFAVTDIAGNISLSVPGGAFAGTYKMSVVPQGNSPFGAVFDQEVGPGPNPQAVKLPDRVAITGTVVDVSGNPLVDVQVTAVPSLRFQWDLTEGPQTFISEIPSATDVTLETGEFVLHIDPSIGDAFGEVLAYYDLTFTPADDSNGPSFTIYDVAIPFDPQLSTVPLNTIGLPDVAHIHGRIVDPFGDVVEGAELKLFRTPDPNAAAVFCADLRNAPPTCPIPAILLGRGVTDVDGVARLTLAR